MIDFNTLKDYVKEVLGAELLELRRLGKGVHGEGFLLRVQDSTGVKEYVLKDLAPHDLGHDYPSDRAQVFLLAYDSYNELPGHIRAIDILQLKRDKSIVSIKDGLEYFLLMEKAEGINYFTDLERLKNKSTPEPPDVEKIRTMAGYLARIHSVRPSVEPSLKRSLYIRKLRDTIGHGECLMGVFDTYPEGTLAPEEMAEIEKLSIDWRYRLRTKVDRLCQIHGDFHPGNIWFRNSEFILLDRSRGPWGEAADDITALTINYIFFSIKNFGDVHPPYSDCLKIFYNEYINLTGDMELLEMVPLFYAFRASVVANPLFYPEVSQERRRLLFNFMKNVLRSKGFKPEDVAGLLNP